MFRNPGGSRFAAERVQALRVSIRNVPEPASVHVSKQSRGGAGGGCSEWAMRSASFGEEERWWWR